MKILASSFAFDMDVDIEINETGYNVIKCRYYSYDENLNDYI